ncbi:MAG TPA: penicillin-insensitive murein endopeptidase [Bdellovibrionales bacterium]|nr:penicillin-insensitive murein endopeptidase [Bdellovibrionales bacterium]
MAKFRLISILFVMLAAVACAPAYDPLNEDEGFRGPLVRDESPEAGETEETETADPTQGKTEQATGFYSNGKLLNGLALPLEGFGFLKIQRPRNRHFSTFDLIEVIKATAKLMKEAFPNGERLQIGDMSWQKGGKLSSHKSHQNGLDADIAYFRRDRREQNPALNIPFDEGFVKNGKLTANFDVERNWHFFNVMVSTGRVKRLFVDAVIKREMCAYARKLGLDTEKSETLRRMRIEPLHHDHVHLRISCPKKSPNCQQQLDPPEGSACDALWPEEL